MVWIPSLHICIDRYEASEGPAGEAASAAGVMPWSGASLQTARAACAAAGKHVCTRYEWRCVGEEELTYPYGDTYDAASCNGADYPGTTLVTLRNHSNMFLYE